MKSPLIIGNWKSHKTVQEAKDWFAEAAASPRLSTTPRVVLCPSFSLLSLCASLIAQYQLHWELGSQDVSPFPQGKHTGAVNAVQVKDFAQYILIGHSERRHEFGETDAVLFEKVKRAKEAGLMPIFFVQDEKTPIPDGIEIVAYEPIFAIGTGTADTPEDAEKVAHFFKVDKQVPTVLYGGSVDDKNVHIFMSCSSIDGIVPGTASLDPVVFTRLIQNA